jgi:hypothetical protein
VLLISVGIFLAIHAFIYPFGMFLIWMFSASAFPRICILCHVSYFNAAMTKLIMTNLVAVSDENL